MKYCKTCLYPDTKPNIIFGEDGICSACKAYTDRSDINWVEREAEFLRIADKFRSKDGSNYDCLIPVSGGKDSTYQVMRVLQLGLNPLCVTATTCALTELGRRNIENLKNLGVDYIEYTTNPVVRRRLNKFCLEQVGDISWPEHVTIFTTPVRVAAQMGIRLIVWGENSNNEYGGPAGTAQEQIFDRRYLEEFGGLIGLRVTDLSILEGVRPQDLIPYSYPSDEDLHRVGVTGLFLGYYFPWDGLTNAIFSQAHGFETYPHNVEGSLTNYENLDNYQAGIHDYFKFLKFGFGRATDLANNHLRRGRLSRRDAVSVIAKWDGKFPWTYLGQPIQETLRNIDLTLDEFITICDRFTNKKLFRCDSRGNLVKDERGNLTLLHTP